MKELLDSQVKALEEVYLSSKLLVTETSTNAQEVADFCYALRFLLRLSPGTEVFVAGIEKLITHLESLRIVATSYHKAVGELLEEME